MSDLIDRRKAIDALKEYEDEESDNFTKIDPLSMMTVATIANCIEAIVELPSAEPERKKGKWIEYPDCLRYEGAYNDDHIVCSECGHVFSICDNCTEEFDFCPHCGADMRGDR